MIMPNDSCFYVLCYPESVSKSQLKLYGFSIADGSHRQYATIPILSDKIPAL
ncbi:hypothetical protein [Phocaeicola sp.]|uniref:hypothetical protein n=1 Tax=Phocaeicola sp. TaxID=2773926 RepID=UPI00261D857D|nr:hypothetical protein [Phocaeicola sp.]